MEKRLVRDEFEKVIHQVTYFKLPHNMKRKFLKLMENSTLKIMIISKLEHELSLLKDGPEDQLQRERILRQLGPLYSDFENKALGCYLQLLELIKEKATPYELGTCYKKIGEAYEIENQYQEALATFQKSLEILENNGGTEKFHEEILDIYASIFTIYGDLEDNAKAAEYQQKIMELHDKGEYANEDEEVE